MDNLKLSLAKLIMKNIILAKNQGADFGKETRDTLGGGGYIEPPSTVIENMDLAGAITHWANILAGLAGGIGVAALIVGGIMWATAAGDEEKLVKAKSVLKLTIFGLILTLTAWVITSTVMSNFG
jgi:hypothetical protein